MIGNKLGQILVVDDDVELKNALVEALNVQGYDVAGFSSGHEALAALHAQNFDVLLSDLMMPEMDGLILLRTTLEIDPHLVCIIMTGQGTIQTAVDAMKVGAFDYVLKPFRLEALLPVLTRAINVRRLRQENLQLRETVAIYELSQTIAFTLDPQTVLSKLADAALQQIKADEVSILLPTDDGSELYVAAVRGENRERLLGERIPLEQGISSWVARERTPLLLEGQVNDPRFTTLWPRPDIRSAISVPLQIAGKLVGIININTVSGPRPFTLGQMKALTILASIAAAALESTSLYGQVRQAEKNYRSIFENAIEGIFQSTPDGQFITVNPSMARILGYESPEEMIATITDITHQLYVDPERRAEAARLQEQGDLQGFEFEAYRKDGKRIWLSLNRRSVRDERGAEIYREGSIEDITERKRSEEALRESEDRYRDLVEHSNDLICTHDLEGRMLSVNQTAAKVLGYDRDALLGRNIREALLPEFRDQFENYITEIQKNGIARGLMTVQTRTGEKRVWEYTNTLRIEGVDVPIVRGMAHDVTEQRRAEEALRESEERYRVVAETATDVIITIDENSTILFANGTVERMFGYAVSELLGKQITMLMPEYLRHVHKAAVSRYVQTSQKHTNWESVELTGLHKSGQEIPLEISLGEFSKNGRRFFTGIARDMTERKRFEEALQREKEYTEHIISAAPTLIVGIAPDGATTFINHAITRVTGYGPEEIVGQNWWRTHYPGAEYRQVDQLFEEFKQGRAVVNYEMTLTTKSGSKRTVSWNSVNRSNKQGEIIEIIGIGADVTERRELEDQLRQSQKMEAVGQLAGGVAHDFNNLLTVIIGYSDLLLSELGRSEPPRLKVEEIKKAGERAASLTRQLLAFSRRQVLQPKVLNLNAIVADVEKMLRRLIGEDIDLLTVLEPSLNQIKADPGQIEQVILNLVVNARDAMPQGGKLTIETANVYLDNKYARKHMSIQPGHYVMLVVSDTGCGMNAETQARMFEPFFTTKEQGKGTGLGLSTVYGIVKQSGANIWAYSEVGKGTAFKIYLPRADGVVESDESRETPAELPQGRETVMLAEDEEQVRRMIREILEMNGYRVLEASSGKEALSIYKQYGEQIDLILTDAVMPQMSGRELAQSLETLNPGIKVLYMSGYTDDAIVRHGLLDQGIAFLQKPFTPEALTRKVREVLDAVE